MTKAEIRQKVWQTIQREGAARFPGALGRVPNFAGAERAAQLLREMAVWRRALVVKVNPDAPQLPVRRLALAEGKILYMAVPRLRSDKPFIELDPKKLKCSPFVASSIKGAAEHGRPVRLSEVRKIDLVVCGSVAVNRGGARAGKGGGYSDLEFALLTEEKKIGGGTPIVTSVHPLQIVDEEIPMTEHDIPLNAIVTAEEVINPRSFYARPKGIYWRLLETEKIDQIPVLKARSPKHR